MVKKYIVAILLAAILLNCMLVLASCDTQKLPTGDDVSNDENDETKSSDTSAGEENEDKSTDTPTKTFTYEEAFNTIVDYLLENGANSAIPATISEMGLRGLTLSKAVSVEGKAGDIDILCSIGVNNSNLCILIKGRPQNSANDAYSLIAIPQNQENAIRANLRHEFNFSAYNLNVEKETEIWDISHSEIFNMTSFPVSDHMSAVNDLLNKKSLPVLKELFAAIDPDLSIEAFGLKW